VVRMDTTDQARGGFITERETSGASDGRAMTRGVRSPSSLRLPQKSIIYRARAGTGTGLCLRLPARSPVSGNDPPGSPKLPGSPRAALPGPGRAGEGGGLGRRSGTQRRAGPTASPPAVATPSSSPDLRADGTARGVRSSAPAWLFVLRSLRPCAVSFLTPDWVFSPFFRIILSFSPV